MTSILGGLLLPSAQISQAGSIAAWGYDGYGDVSNAPTGTGFTAIAGGVYTGYALKSIQETAVATPEPATIISASIAILGGIGYGWRRRKAKLA